MLFRVDGCCFVVKQEMSIIQSFCCSSYTPGKYCMQTHGNEPKNRHRSLAPNRFVKHTAVKGAISWSSGWCLVRCRQSIIFWQLHWARYQLCMFLNSFSILSEQICASSEMLLEPITSITATSTPTTSLI